MNRFDRRTQENLLSVIDTADTLLTLSNPKTPRGGMYTPHAEMHKWVYEEPDLVVSKTIATHYSKHTDADFICLDGFSKKQLAKVQLPDTATRLIDKIETSYVIRYRGELVFQGSLNSVQVAPPGYLASRLKNSYHRLFAEKTAGQDN